MDVIAIPGATGFMDPQTTRKSRLRLDALRTHDFVYSRGPDGLVILGAHGLKVKTIGL
jgi:2,3-bisphosphoglycerate-independent phosphoglycerate mutase